VLPRRGLVDEVPVRTDESRHGQIRCLSSISLQLDFGPVFLTFCRFKYRVLSVFIFLADHPIFVHTPWCACAAG